MAIQVMREVGIDISRQQSKSVSAFTSWSFDFVITVCDGEACPFFQGETGIRLAWSFEDPAAVSGTDKDILGVFRRVRDEIEARIMRFITEYG
jgi:arsenate reductase